MQHLIDRALCISGDMMRDIYNIGYRRDDGRFDINKQISLDGGAGRAGTIVKNLSISHYPLYLKSAKCKSLTRYIEDEILLLEAWNEPRFINTDILIDRIEFGSLSVYGIHLDYGLYDYTEIADKYQFFILDSRYASFPIEKINAVYKVWHCTDNEYNIDYAQKFDAVVWSHGNKNIDILDMNYHQKMTVPVLEIEYIAPFGEVGCGDALTATIGAYMYYHVPDKCNDIQTYFSLLISATNAGIKVAQSTLGKSFITDTHFTIEDL